MKVKIIERPIAVEKKTNLGELLAELRKNFTGCLASSKGCEDFQDECWRILIQFEKEAKKENDITVGKYTLRKDSLDSIVIFKFSDGEAGRFSIQKLEKQIDEFWDKEF